MYVNDVLVIDGLVPTVRSYKKTETATAELQLTVGAGENVVVSIRAKTTGAQAVKNVFINGLQLNGTNPGKKSRSPVPSDRNEHLEVANGGSYLLRWEASPVALSHDVYFGTDPVAIMNAGHGSPLFKGNQPLADTSFEVTSLYSMDTYYWRVDEVTSTGTYKGDIWTFRTAQLAFPGAEGYGRFARGGRGGKVVEVTNLNDAGPGSLREAVTNDIGPRTIVFAVSGIIALQSRLVLSQPYVTIAGQTAPGKGICIRSAPFGITGNDCIIRDLRVRLGGGRTFDGMGLTGANYSIMDHCSISWTIDEAFSSRGGKNITLQRTLISEALNAAGHQNYPAGTEHGYAATIGGDIGSYHHNLLAHCYGRNWSLGGGLDGSGFYSGRLDITNNVVYNWGARPTDGGAMEVNFVNNYYKRGAGTKTTFIYNAQHEGTGKGMQRCYFNGNVVPGLFDETNQAPGKKVSYSNGDTSSYQTFVNAPFFPSFVTTQTAYDAYKNVLSDIGCNQPGFDDHDTRMISETLTGTYSVVGSYTGKPGFPDNEADAGGYENYPALSRDAGWDSDHDGMPNWWEILKGFNPGGSPGDFSESNDDADGDGVTALEHYLNWMAEAHFILPGNPPLDIDLKLMARGYPSVPVFTLSNVVNGTASVVDGIVTFIPAGTGLGGFHFTVIDSEGSSMTRKVNIVSGIDHLLPVNTIIFSAVRKSAGVVLLAWETSQEINNAGFEIQRREKGDNSFLPIGFTTSKATNGNSSQAISYTFTDTKNSSGASWYRLAQRDKDGRVNHSAVRLVKGIATEPVLQVWPSPNHGRFAVTLSDYGTDAGMLQIFDAGGRIAYSRQIKNNSTTHVRLSNPGLYYLKLVDVDGGEMLTRKIIVQ